MNAINVHQMHSILTRFTGGTHKRNLPHVFHGKMYRKIIIQWNRLHLPFFSFFC